MLNVEPGPVPGSFEGRIRFYARIGSGSGKSLSGSANLDPRHLPGSPLLDDVICSDHREVAGWIDSSSPSARGLHQ